MHKTNHVDRIREKERESERKEEEREKANHCQYSQWH